ncbi:ABC transporter substrate-binding protein [Bradyrhizobium yuanmingense]|uniref:ABC transporter substrate-binding protein n=1 Tax=Bradyrhizobium yuanmingense TaxID=108015 RepID=UPI0023B9CCD8|nr:ABC transporter substrate-binding protein [Bradyrhizobium yuanmingense]MDF0497245.1 ABC transporter substrate-binding protein [Bradyrhizobium yuanmingense]MDF0521055.1 ABC transporter substrate-binding protein [Bradyrhizobium yuanmingense]
MADGSNTRPAFLVCPLSSPAPSQRPQKSHHADMMSLTSGSDQLHAQVDDFVGYLRGERRLYWDMTEETRAFAKRYKAAFDGRIPNEAQASTYSAVTHYLKAIAAIRTDEGEAVVRQMRNTSIKDF